MQKIRGGTPQYRPLGHSGLLVSRLALGTLQVGGREGFEKCGGIDLRTLSRLFDIAFDAASTWWIPPTGIPTAWPSSTRPWNGGATGKRQGGPRHP
ncbi:hypothetical protein [Pseudomonas oryzihabitans]|uniref:Uncharacterized protein n=1 Tax=Pseudomonas oryzihabitans TaxID=47885 RepID=A0AAJ2EWU9_9PSED|nr:hypothetical protein [Pseudomonas psychrotolerans]